MTRNKLCRCKECGTAFDYNGMTDVFELAGHLEQHGKTLDQFRDEWRNKTSLTVDLEEINEDYIAIEFVLSNTEKVRREAPRLSEATGGLGPEEQIRSRKAWCSCTSRME